MLGRDSEAPPCLGRDASDESERDHGGETAEGEMRPGLSRSGATALERRRFSVQHGPRVVVGAGMVRVRILGEDDELAGIVGPVAQRVEVERTPERPLRRGRLHPCERVAVSHTPPAFHADPDHVSWTQGAGRYTDWRGGQSGAGAARSGASSQTRGRSQAGPPAVAYRGDSFNAVLRVARGGDPVRSGAQRISDQA